MVRSVLHWLHKIVGPLALARRPLRRQRVEISATAKGKTSLVAHKLPPPVVVPTSLGIDEVAEVTAGKHSLRVHSSGGPVEAIRVSNSDGTHWEADLTQAQLSTSITSVSPQGESGALDVCEMLINRLNQDGGRWGSPTRPAGPEDGVDCTATDGGDRLLIQVTRVAPPTIWQRLARVGTVKTSGPVKSAAEELYMAVKRKTGIPPQQRAAIVLALDVMRTPGHATTEVITEFQQSYGAWAAGLGFKDIWVVGPTLRLTARLTPDRRPQV